MEGLPGADGSLLAAIGPAARWGVLVLKVAPVRAPTTTAIDSEGHRHRYRRQEAGTQRTAGFGDVGATATRSEHSGHRETRPVARPGSGGRKGVRSQHFRRRKPNASVKSAMGKEEKANGPVVVMKQGEKATVPVKVEWTTADKQNVTLHRRTDDASSAGPAGYREPRRPADEGQGRRARQHRREDQRRPRHLHHRAPRRVADAVHERPDGEAEEQRAGGRVQHADPDHGHPEFGRAGHTGGALPNSTTQDRHAGRA